MNPSLSISNFFLLSVIAGALVSAGCNTSATKSINVQPVETPKIAEPESKRSPKSQLITDPTCCGLLTSYRVGVDEVWRLFTKDGRYRLALEQDMKFSAAALSDIGSREGRVGWTPYNRVFAYSWGRLGYDTEQEHLAAIVVDSTRTDDSRFGLVIFRKPKGSDSYKPHWLYRERALSRSIVTQTTGSLNVTDYREDGTYHMCGVEWNRSKKKYVCA